MAQQQELLSKLIIFCIQNDGKSGSDFISNCNLSGCSILLKVALRTFSFYWCVCLGGGGGAFRVKPRFSSALSISWNFAFLNVSIGTGFYSSKIKIFLTANEVMHCLYAAEQFQRVIFERFCSVSFYLPS